MIFYFTLKVLIYGVGMATKFLARNDQEEKASHDGNQMGPHWDGNEVWLITAGGAMFAGTADCSRG